MDVSLELYSKYEKMLMKLAWKYSGSNTSKKEELKREIFNNGSCKKCRQSALANRLKTLEAML